MTEDEQSKREFIKKSAYVVPCILTLKAIPSFAGSGSGEAKIAGSCSYEAVREAKDARSGFGEDVKGNNGVGNGEDFQPRGNPPVNDGPGTGPGNPGNNQTNETEKRLGKEHRSEERRGKKHRS